MKFDFLSIQVIKGQQCLWISKTFALTLSRVVQKYLENWFFICFIINCGKNRGIYKKNCSLSKSSRNKNGEIVYSIFTIEVLNKKIQIKLFRKQSKLRTVIKLVHTFTLRYSLAGKTFPKLRYSVVATKCSMSLKFNFCQWKINFSQFIFIDKYLKFKEIKYFIHCIKSEVYQFYFM